jgi:hypothetical protein
LEIIAMSRLQGASLCFLFGFGIFTQIILSRYRRQPETALPVLWGHLTAQQAMTLSAPVFQALLPRHGDLLLSAEPQPGRDRLQHRLWCIDCVDGHGRDQAHLLLDADSSEILIVGCEIDRECLSRVAVEKTVPEATARVRFWLSRLGYPIVWRLIGTPKHTGVWQVVLVTDQRKAIVMIDAEQGNLLSAVIRPR